MRVTERDINIIKAVYSLGMLSSEHIEVLFFSSSTPGTRSRRSACQRRLQLLFHHRFLKRLVRRLIPGEGRAPFVYTLDEAGAHLITNQLGIDRAALTFNHAEERTSNLFLEHSLAINDFRVTLILLARKKGWQLTNWVSDTAFKSKAYQHRVPFYQRGARIVRVYPDGYFRLIFGEEKQAHYFLEVDRGTMSNARWQRKMEAYLSFRSSGLSKHHFATHNFRVLTVTTSAKRLANLKRATEAVGGEFHFWFTTAEHISIYRPETLLEPVWSVATSEKKQAAFGL